MDINRKARGIISEIPDGPTRQRFISRLRNYPQTLDQRFYQQLAKPDFSWHTPTGFFQTLSQGIRNERKSGQAWVMMKGKGIGANKDKSLFDLNSLDTTPYMQKLASHISTEFSTRVNDLLKLV